MYIAIALVVVIAIGTVGYRVIGAGEWSFLDALYMTIITVSTVGFKEVHELSRIAHQGRNVIMDGTAHRRSMRENVRQLVPRFAEIYVRCSLETAIRREKGRPEGLVMAGLYDKALRRKRTGVQFEGLGEVVGVDTAFEEDPSAECVIYSERDSVEEGRDKVLAFLARWQ